MRITIGIIFVLIVLGVGLLFLTNVDHSRSVYTGGRLICEHNFKKIGLALLNYEKEYGELPPACTVDANGKPLHSWRTLLLPYLDEQKLYDSIDLDKPWNDPINQKAARTTPRCYACVKRPAKLGNTYYQAVLSERSAFQKLKSHSLKEITDEPSCTMLVIESSLDKAVPWMSPIDVDWSSHAKGFSIDFRPHAAGSYVLFGDGSTNFFSRSMEPRILESASTISGGEIVPKDFGL